MFKLKNTLSISLITALVMSLVPTTAFANHTRADIESNLSVFTPANRATVAYRNPDQGGVHGLTYPSFNNFINNPNIPGDRNNDERLFTVAQHCPAGNCNQVDGIFYNTTDALEAGDHVMFSLYFHNNADDPHKAGNLGVEPARNVRIGIDLNNIVDHSFNDILRPKGFITADNTEYRTNINNPDTVITTPVPSGGILDPIMNVPLRTVTDDIQVPITQEGMTLRMVPRTAQIKFKPENIIRSDANQNEIIGDKLPILDELNVTLRTDDGTEVQVRATAHLSDDHKKMWLTFDELPGCFRYSGFVYFEAEVVAPPVQPEPNICTALEATIFGGPREMPNGKIAFPLTITQARFREVTPANSRILWQSPEDPNGEFYTSSLVNGARVFTMISNNGTTVTPFTNGQVLFYAGNGPVTYRVANVADNLANLNKCSGELDIPVIPDEPSFCTSLGIVDNSYQINKLASGKTQHRFIVENPIFSNGEIPANTKIRLTTTNNNGTFQVFSTRVFPPRFINLAEVARNTVELTPGNQNHIINYLNDGTVDTITTSLNPSALNNNLCTANLTTEIIPVIPPGPVCREILVNYQDPIYENTETLFTAESFYENGGQFAEGKIRYSVDDGHGSFSNRENPDTPNNPAPRREVSSRAAVANNANELNDAGGANGNNIIQFFPQAAEPQQIPLIPARPAERINRPIIDIRQNANPFGNVVIPQAAANFGLDQLIAPNAGIQIDGLIQNRVPFQPNQLPQRGLFNSVLNAEAAGINNNAGALQINQRVLNGPAQQGQSITADPNEGVFLSSLLPGNNVVHVDQLDADGNPIEQCSADFNITGVRCQKITYEIDGVQEPLVIDRNEIHTIRAAARFSGVPDPTDNNITYAIEETYGAFIENPAAAAALANITDKTKANIEAALRAANIDPATTLQTDLTRKSSPESFHLVMYADAPEAGGIILSIYSSKDSEHCQAQIQVLPDTPDQPICLETAYDLTHLKFVSPIVGLGREPSNKIERSAMYEVIAKSKFQNAEALVSGQNQLKVSIPAEYGAILNPTNSINANEFALRTLAALQEGSSFTAETLRAFAAQMSNGADLIQQSAFVNPSQPFIVVTYSNAPNAATVLTIEQLGFEQTCNAKIPIPENLNRVCTELKFDGSFAPTNRITEMKIRVNEFPKTGIKITSNGKCKLSKQSAPSTVYDEINFVEGENLTFYIICENYNAETDNIEITADGGPDCKQQIKIPPTPKPPVPPEEICVDLDITTPNTPWNIDENDDRQNFEIAVQTNPTNLKDKFYYNFEVTNGAGTWAENDRKTVSARGDLTQTLEDFDGDTRVSVYASSDANGQNAFAACRDSISARLDRDTPPPRTEKPEIEKVVYPENDIDEATSQINIGDKDQMPYVSYMAVFTPGSKTKSLEIQENSLKNGRIRGNLNGELVFKAIEIIAVENFNSEKGEILYRSNAYKKDSSRDHAGDHNYTYNNKDFDCDNAGSKICIEDFDNIEDNFKNGKEIRFDNLDKIKTNGRIIIKYQMENRSEIDDDRCKKLSATTGCGEKFDNTIEYTSYEKTEWKTREDSDKDSAKVTVTCPYTLARQGGDTLMYKGFDFGVDISTCSPVKNTTDIVVEILPEEKPRIPSTGTDANGNPKLLELPTHDICRYSNTDQNIESYKNVLKNFSSTVCELQAKVAETLYEENINKAINANINRLARFGDNLTVKTLSSMANLTNLENAKSGVFIKTNGDLTIDNGTNDFKIEKSGDIRAAQTYIVRGHDLIIKSNIAYGATNFTDPRNIPSVAFIVIDGNIIIDKNVERLDGIYMAVNLSKKDGIGEISNSAKSTKRLTINGSLIGNVYNLFKDRTATGNPLKDEGSVTIKYDERILLNTPPGISDLVDIKQAIVP